MDCIISEVNIGLGVVESVLGGGCADVSSFEPVSFESSVYNCPQHVVPNVEFPTVVQEGLLDVFLHNECLWGTVVVSSSSLQDTFYFLKGKANCDAISSIRKLSWFHDPNIIKAIHFSLLPSFVKSLQKNGVLLIIDSLFNME